MTMVMLACGETKIDATVLIMPHKQIKIKVTVAILLYKALTFI